MVACKSIVFIAILRLSAVNSFLQHGARQGLTQIAPNADANAEEGSKSMSHQDLFTNLQSKVGAFSASLLAGIAIGSILLEPTNVDAVVRANLLGVQERTGRLYGCPRKGVCLSTTAVKSIEKYRAPWTFKEGDKPQANANDAFAHLVEVLKGESAIKIVQADSDKLYLRAEARGATPTGIDDIEFLLLQDTDEGIVTFRSAARDSPSLGPIEFSDGGVNENRIVNLRRKIGWAELGAIGPPKRGSDTGLPTGIKGKINTGLLDGMNMYDYFESDQ